jgi:hypothetical protein
MVKEETVLRIGSRDRLDREDLERRLDAAVRHVVGEPPQE